MFRYDRILVAPSKSDLNRALVDAAKAANKGSRSRMLSWQSAHMAKLLRDCTRNPEGYRQWNGEGERKSRGFGKDTRSAVGVAWWFDPFGRLHFRIVADRVFCASRHVDNMLCPYVERPPLWLVYPECVYFAESDGELVLRACCRCGACGTPEAILWMGTCCGPCHDRVSEGVTVARVPQTLLLAGSAGWVGGAVFAHNGRTLVSHARCGSEILIWDLVSGKCMTPGFASRAVGALAISPDGDTVASQSDRDRVVLWSLSDGKPIRELTVLPPSYFGQILDLAFSPDGTTLAVMPYGRAELWDVASGQFLEVVAPQLFHHSPGRYLTFSPDGATLFIAASRDLILWDVAAKQSTTVELCGTRCPKRISFSSDGKTIGLIDDMNPECVYLEELENARTRAVVQVRNPSDFAFSPNGRWLAVVCGDGSMQLHSASDGSLIGAYAWHTNAATSVAFSPDGNWIATAADDGFVKLWPIGLLR